MEKSASLPDSVSSAGTLGDPRNTVVDTVHRHTHSEPANDMRDFLIHKDGKTYAGAHLLVDLWGVNCLTNPEIMADVLTDAAEAAGATILHIHVHEFGGEGGVSGVAVLAESHISVHTWPELNYAAFDVFMCGTCNPEKAVETLRARLNPDRLTVDERKRGIVE